MPRQHTMKTTIFNLYGGPGTGKSTSAAFMYFVLKSLGKNSELVREYVKEWAWEGRQFGIFDQIYFLGKQVRKESMLYGKVDFIITDSPIMLNAYYGTKHCSTSIGTSIATLVSSFYRQAEVEGHKHVHVMLQRSKDYNPAGRYQTEAEARHIDIDMRDFLNQYNIPYQMSRTDNDSLTSVLKTTLCTDILL